MTTTTLKLKEELKHRVRDAAADVGITPHAFMIAAIERQTGLAERRRAFVGHALAAEEEVAQYGLVYDGDEALSYFLARLEGRNPARPRKRRV
jgi:predicted transcriptional regulator